MTLNVLPVADQQYECYHWTVDDQSWKSANGASMGEMCERHEGYVYSQGNETLAPGCGTCWCCKPATGIISHLNSQYC